MKWRLMRSAPKHEEIMLACDGGSGDLFVTIGRWTDVPHHNQLMDSWEKGDTRNAQEIPAEGYWREAHIGIMQSGGACKGRTWEARTSILFHPKRWMPIPKPPSRKKSK